MEKKEIIMEKIRDLLAMLDASEAPAVYDFLSAIAMGDAEDLHPTLSIVYALQEKKPLPQLVWDFIFDLLETEAEDGNDDAMNDLGAM